MEGDKMEYAEVLRQYNTKIPNLVFEELINSFCSSLLDDNPNFSKEKFVEYITEKVKQ